jgi:hypothetical protein
MPFKFVAMTTLLFASHQKLLNSCLPILLFFKSLSILWPASRMLSSLTSNPGYFDRERLKFDQTLLGLFDSGLNGVQRAMI